MKFNQEKIVTNPSPSERINQIHTEMGKIEESRQTIQSMREIYDVPNRNYLTDLSGKKDYIVNLDVLPSKDDLVYNTTPDEASELYKRYAENLGMNKDDFYIMFYDDEKPWDEIITFAEDQNKRKNDELLEERKILSEQ